MDMLKYIYFCSNLRTNSFVSAKRKKQTNKKNLPRVNETLKKHSKISHKGLFCRTSWVFVFFLQEHCAIYWKNLTSPHFVLNSWLCNPFGIITKSSCGSQRTQICIQIGVSHFKVATSKYVNVSCK